MMFKSAVLAAAIGGASASFEKIKTFTPLTGVTDHAAISFDQTSMETLLSGMTETAFAQAQRVYIEGGNSKTIAKIRINGGVTREIAAGTKLTGKGIDGRDVVGSADSAAAVGDPIVNFKYPVGTSFDDHLDCRVGGLPENEHVTEGCLVASGSVIIDGSSDTLSYNYTVTEDNDNGRTLQFFSDTANVRMRPGDNPTANYFDTFQPFFDYYGSYNYADQIITAAFDNGNTNFVNGNVNVQSSSAQMDARVEIAKKGTAYLSVAMYVLRELEDALYDCDTKCTIGQCNDDSAVHALDEAVAFYYGTDDNFMHSLANKRCANFATCLGDDPVEGDAAVNDYIFQKFGEMQTFLQRGECDNARPIIDQIANKMWVSLIQGTLRYAWILDTTNNPAALVTTKAQAEGAIFAAGVLPVIHKCDPNAASTIYENMKMQTTVKVDFVAVKSAFEGCYSKIGITCADVGGIVNSGGNGYDNEKTRPCDFSANNQFSASSMVTVGSLVGASILAMATMLL